MSIIKKLKINYVIIIWLFVSSCVAKKTNTSNDCFMSDCIKLENIEMNFSEKFYDNVTKNNYFEFKKSQNDIEVIILETKYGYSPFQSFNRIYSNDKGKSFILINKQGENMISKTNGDSLIQYLNSLNLKSLYINCKESNSVKYSYNLFVKKKGKNSFSFASNTSINELSNSLSKNEIIFAKKLIEVCNEK